MTPRQAAPPSPPAQAPRPAADEPTPLLEAAALALRLRQETARALRYRRALTVLCVQPADPLRAAEAARLAVRAVRFVDIVGWADGGVDGGVDGGDLVVVLPETGASAAVPAGRLLDALQAAGIAARLGLARCPEDATDAVALLEGARAAAAVSQVGTVQPLEDSTSVALSVGGQAIVAVDPKTRRLFELVRELARSDIATLIEGETGVGKEVVARALHAWSPRAAAPFLALNCAAMTETLLESELFGHERGAFSGADSSKAGLLESASGGVVFLDEIGEAAPRTQAELLRVLETRRVRRLGSLREHAIDVRFVAATNRDLAREVERGTFRRDLYYRLNAASLLVPRLADRPLDVPALLRTHLDTACRQRGRPVPWWEPEALQALLRHDWPGNVRELRNAIDYVVAVCPAESIGVAALPEPVLRRTPWLRRAPEGAASSTAAACDPRPEGPFLASRGRRGPWPRLADELRELEGRRMREALERCEGVRVRAAELIGMPLRTFVTKLRQYGLQDAGRAED